MWLGADVSVVDRSCRRRVILAAAVSFIWHLSAPISSGQDSVPLSTRNVQLLGSVAPDLINRPVAGARYLPDVALDQDPARPLAYVSVGAVISVVDVADPSRPRVRQNVAIDRSIGQGPVVRDLAVATIGARRLIVAAVEAEQGNSPESTMAVIDVTHSPARPPSLVLTVTLPGTSGFSRVFPYKHSGGRELVIAVGGGDAFVFDLELALSGVVEPLARIETPPRVDTRVSGFDGAYAAFEPDSQQDRMYLAGAGGYYVFDFTDPAAPTLHTRVDAAAVHRGARAVATPDARLLVTSAGYRLSPLYIFDLSMAVGTDIKTVRTAIGAWTADWRHYAENFEVRWPYIFVAALFDGFQVVNMRDESDPYTVGYYRTWTGDLPELSSRSDDLQGSWSVDVRNHDGLIAIGDTERGLLLFTVEGFQGWHGRGWGLPNASSVQDWENGPDGSTLSSLQRMGMSGG